MTENGSNTARIGSLEEKIAEVETGQEEIKAGLEEVKAQMQELKEMLSHLIKNANTDRDCIYAKEAEHKQVEPGLHIQGDELVPQSNIESFSACVRSSPSLQFPNYTERLQSDIQVGARCQVEPGNKRGVVAYVGRAETLPPGFWVGIHLDEPLGKHDGMVRGKRYFYCPPFCGIMVKPESVKVGDFLEGDPFKE